MTTVINNQYPLNLIPNPNYSTEELQVKQNYCMLEFDLNLDEKQLDSLHRSIINIIKERGDERKRTTNVKAQMTDWKMHDEYKSFEFIARCVENILKDFYTKVSSLDLETFIASCWGGIYGRGDYSEIHAHEPGFYNFVYYVKADDTCAPIVFTDIDARDPRRVYYPKEGKGVIFPAYIRHEVPVHNSDFERVMVVGNIEGTGSINYPQRPFLR